MALRDALADRFVATGGHIRWRELARTLGGSTLLAMAAGVTGAILTTGDAVQGLLLGFGAWLSAVVEAIVGTPGDVVSASIAAAVGFVASWGPLGYAVAIALVLVGLWGIAKVRDDE